MTVETTTKLFFNVPDLSKQTKRSLFAVYSPLHFAVISLCDFI